MYLNWYQYLDSWIGYFLDYQVFTSDLIMVSYFFVVLFFVRFMHGMPPFSLGELSVGY